MKLSVLDLVPVRAGQSTSEALTASLSLAKVADELGYERYWLAEHHNMPSVAATNPAILIAMVAAATSRMRVGSGGVMLPNHAPLVVAEQFALLEAAYPGRIDLGIGRAPGSDPVTTWALRYGGGVEADAVNRFPEYVENVLAMMSPDGFSLSVSNKRYDLRATPRATSEPATWLLGSSMYSAQLAAQLGLPYVFAHHFSGENTEEALVTYRSQFRPGVSQEPRTFLTLNACVAATAEEAEALVRPYLLAMIALRTGQELTPQISVEDAAAAVVPPQHERLAAAMRRRWVVGDPAQAKIDVAELAEQFGVDEVMIHPVSGARAADPLTVSPGREHTLQLLAGTNTQ
ncbi:MAG: LLM class flavin-dependent oxidoreductase [Nocardioidaceae bacterium]|nr:MAG: LLM class flavin-dependent oxidoreductase [Nocardioidaceae bacterium]